MSILNVNFLVVFEKEKNNNNDSPLCTPSDEILQTSLEIRTKLQQAQIGYMGHWQTKTPLFKIMFIKLPYN